MASRLELHEELCTLLGSRYVYFQPPESLKLNYPCIVYNPSGIEKLNADDRSYISTKRYDGLVIDYDPDSDIINSIGDQFAMSSIGASYVVDNLNHTPFTIFY